MNSKKDIKTEVLLLILIRESHVNLLLTLYNNPVRLDTIELPNISTRNFSDGQRND